METTWFPRHALIISFLCPWHIQVKWVKEDGPALGLVMEGDLIVSIDGWALTNVSNQDLVRLTLGYPGH